MSTTEGTSLITLAQAERELRDAMRAVKDEDDRHTTQAARLEQTVKEARCRRDLVLAGTPLDVVKTAETVLDVLNPEKATYGEGRGAVLAAIEDLSYGPEDLLTRYFGTKDYDRWRGQRDDGSYGTAPSHGATVFKVGLREPYRKRTRWDGDLRQQVPVERMELTEEQRGACIAYLHALIR